MKKSLSILLSLLMILGTITCMFTMPVSAEEVDAPVAQEEPLLGEALPENILAGYKSPDPKTVTNTTVESVPFDSGVAAYTTSARLEVQWGNRDGSDTNSLINKNTKYQLDFTVTVSETLSGTVKVYPQLWSNDATVKVRMVGVYADVNDPGLVKTAYNYTASSSNTPDLAGVASVEAGKTYKYTYVFDNVPSDNCNRINVKVDGLAEGESVTVSDGNLFCLDGTDIDLFRWDPEKMVRYLIEENNNVYQRLYGYLNVGESKVNITTLQTNPNGKLYNMYFKGGNVYDINFDLRIATPASYKPLSEFVYFPAMSIYETKELNYTNDYANIKAEGDTFSFVAQSATDNYRSFADGKNPYSYNWTSDVSNNFIRRYVPDKDMFSYEFHDSEGNLLKSRSTKSSGSLGRDEKSTTAIQAEQGNWMNANYNIPAFGQTLEEAAATNASKYVRYTYDATTQEWSDCNTSYKNVYVPAAEDAYVTFSISNIILGIAYDIDDVSVTGTDDDSAIVYKNAKGEVINAPDTEVAPVGNIVFDAGKGEYSIEKYFDPDTVSFAWYVNGEYAGDADTVSANNVSDKVEAVVTYKNILSNAGSFENYASTTTILEAPYTSIDTTNYPNYTGLTTANYRFYNNVPPTGDLWTGWDGNITPKKITDNDGGVTKAKITSDIQAGGGMLNSSGMTGFSYFVGFPTVVTGVQKPTFYKDAGKAKENRINPEITPRSGNKMLRVQASTRTAYRALEGLTTGKTYLLSVYAYNASPYYFLQHLSVKTSPYDGSIVSNNESKVLDSYTTPFDANLTEPVLQSDGTSKETTGINKAKADYVGKWYKITLVFKAESEVAYLGLYNMHKAHTGGYIYLDDLNVIEYDCNGQHLYDEIGDAECNVCGETREYNTHWSFEDGTTPDITATTSDTIEVVDAVDQPEKIGNKYLQYTTNGWGGIAFNFKHEAGYKYRISYDFKVFTYGDDSAATLPNANGIDHTLIKYDDGKYGVASNGIFAGNAAAAALCPAEQNIVTRYWEDGTPFNQSTYFKLHNAAGNGFYARVADHQELYVDAEGNPILDKNGNQQFKKYYKNEIVVGGAIWDEWQHCVVDIGVNEEYNGLVEYGIRPNGSGWVVGVDNFKVEKVAVATMKEADDAVNGTYAFNIRLTGKQGLRFKSMVDLNKLNLAEGARIVEYGTLAVKASAVSNTFRLTREVAKDKVADGQVVCGVAYSEDDGINLRYAVDEENNKLVYTGVLTGISVKNYDVDFAVCSYVIIETADGQRYTVYDETQVISVFDAATKIVEEGTNADDIAAAQKVLDDYAQVVAQ